jgi:hypothetical protein
MIRHELETFPLFPFIEYKVNYGIDRLIRILILDLLRIALHGQLLVSKPELGRSI